MPSNTQFLYQCDDCRINVKSCSNAEVFIVVPILSFDKYYNKE